MEDITGIYRFYLNGELVGEQKNALTSAGRSIIIKSLLGIIPDFARSIALGIDGSANTLNSASTLITNNSLGFEIGRTPVTGGTFKLSGTNDSLVFSGEIKDPYQYEIREVGLYPATNTTESISPDGELLFDFDLIDTFTRNGTASASSLETTSSARIGTKMLNVITGNSTSNYISQSIDNNSLSDLDSYSSRDLFKLALINTSSTSSAASVYFRFYTDASNYYTVPFVTQSSSGYSIVNTMKGDAVLTGSPSWSSISSIAFWNASSQNVKLDGLKIDIGSYVLDTNFGMISRAKLAAPIFKPASIPLTIEYSLIINFSGGI